MLKLFFQKDSNFWFGNACCSIHCWIGLNILYLYFGLIALLCLVATNKPQELDDAVLQRLEKRIYMPLPDPNVQTLLPKNQSKGQSFKLSNNDLGRLPAETKGYSGSDLRALCKEAAMMPIRQLNPQNILTIKVNQAYF